jgi:hypothetical protein
MWNSLSVIFARPQFSFACVALFFVLGVVGARVITHTGATVRHAAPKHSPLRLCSLADRASLRHLSKRLDYYNPILLYINDCIATHIIHDIAADFAAPIKQIVHVGRMSRGYNTASDLSLYKKNRP